MAHPRTDVKDVKDIIKFRNGTQGVSTPWIMDPNTQKGGRGGGWRKVRGNRRTGKTQPPNGKKKENSVEQRVGHRGGERAGRVRLKNSNWKHSYLCFSR